MKAYTYLLTLVFSLIILLFSSSAQPIYYEKINHIEENKQNHQQEKVLLQHFPIKEEPSQPVIQKPKKQQEKQSSSSQQSKAVSPKKETSQIKEVQEKQENSVSLDFSSHQETIIRTTFLKLINETRKTSVALSSSLKSSSAIRAKEASQKWSHTRPNGTRWNTTLTSVIDIKSVAHGENLAQTQINFKNTYTDEEIIKLTQTLHQGLIHSSTHYKVMTNLEYHYVNIGIHTYKKGNHLIITIAQHYIE